MTILPDAYTISPPAIGLSMYTLMAPLVSNDNEMNIFDLRDIPDEDLIQTTEHILQFIFQRTFTPMDAIEFIELCEASLRERIPLSDNTIAFSKGYIVLSKNTERAFRITECMDGTASYIAVINLLTGEVLPVHNNNFYIPFSPDEKHGYCIEDNWLSMYNTSGNNVHINLKFLLYPEKFQQTRVKNTSILALSSL